MKKFTAKTVDDCLVAASTELATDVDNLVYIVTEDKKGFFKRTATIEVYEESDAAEFGADYIKKAITALGVDVNVSYVVEEGIIKINIDSERNPILIGKGGRTLQALNELVKLAVSNKFRHRYRVLLNVGDYKEEKYERVIRIAKRAAKGVLRDHIDVKLEPMTPDERRQVHNALAGWNNIKTESSGEGRERAITIRYVGSNNED